MKKVTEFIWNAPGLWIAKNKNSVYQGISREFLGMFGWKDIDQIAGKTDHDIPCKVSEFANVFISQDRQAVESREKLLTLEIMPFASGWRSVLVERRGISDEKGNADGVLLQAIDVSESSIFRKCMLLNSSDQKTVDTSNKMASYILSAEHSPLPLTKQQEACLFLLIVFTVKTTQLTRTCEELSKIPDTHV